MKIILLSAFLTIIFVVRSSALTILTEPDGLSGDGNDADTNLVLKSVDGELTPSSSHLSLKSQETRNFLYLLFEDYIQDMLKEKQGKVPEEILSRQKRFIFPGGTIRYLRSANTNSTSTNLVNNYWQRMAERRRLRLQRRRQRWQQYRKNQQDFVQNLGKQQAQVMKSLQTLNQNARQQLNAVNTNMASRITAISAATVAPAAKAVAVPVNSV